jgi:hypothetical protein
LMAGITTVVSSNVPYVVTRDWALVLSMVTEREKCLYLALRSA